MQTLSKSVPMPNLTSQKVSPWSGMIRGVTVLWLKHMRKFFRNRMELMGTLYLPLLWLFLFGVCMESMLKSLGGKAAGISYKDFITPGVMLLTGLTAAVMGGSTLLMERLNGSIKEYLIAPVPRLAVLLGTLASGLSKAFLQSLVVLAAGLLLDAGLVVNIFTLLAGLGVIIIFSLGFVGIAAAVASQSGGMEEYHALIMLLNLPLLFLSSALYPLQTMPSIIQMVAYLNPTTYAADAARHLFYGAPLEIGLTLDLSVLVFFMVLGLWYGYRNFQKAIADLTN
jgi:ABC-2 type transport system permease protein